MIKSRLEIMLCLVIVLPSLFRSQTTLCPAPKMTRAHETHHPGFRSSAPTSKRGTGVQKRLPLNRVVFGLMLDVHFAKRSGYFDEGGLPERYNWVRVYAAELRYRF